MNIVFLHGLESGPHGSKYQALTQRFDNVSAPDCTGLRDIEDRLDVITRHVKEPAILVGSSFGGLAAVLFEERHPELVLGMVLCAPALHLIEKVPHPGACTVVIHGTRDNVVPISSSREYARKFGVRLIEVDDDHRLGCSNDQIVYQVRRISRVE